MITKPFGTKVIINPLTVNSFSQDEKPLNTTGPVQLDWILLDGDNFLLLSGEQFDFLGP